MASNVRDSFDQFLAKKPGNEPSAMKDARTKYEAAVKKLAGVAPSDPSYDAAREAKKLAGIAMSDARQKAEADYYADEIKENIDAVTEMKAEASKKGAAQTPAK